MEGQIKHDHPTDLQPQANGQVECPVGLEKVPQGKGCGRRRCQVCLDNVDIRGPALDQGSGGTFGILYTPPGHLEKSDTSRSVDGPSTSEATSSHLESVEEIVAPRTRGHASILVEMTTPPTYGYADTSSGFHTSVYEKLSAIAGQECGTSNYRQSPESFGPDTLRWTANSSTEAAQPFASNYSGNSTSTYPMAAPIPDEEPFPDGWFSDILRSSEIAGEISGNDNTDCMVTDLLYRNRVGADCAAEHADDAWDPHSFFTDKFFDLLRSSDIAGEISGNDSNNCMITDCRYRNKVGADYAAEHADDAWDHHRTIANDARYREVLAEDWQTSLFEEGDIQGNDQEGNKNGYWDEEWDLSS